MRKNLLFGLLITINGILMAQNPVADFNFTNVCLGNSTTFTDLTSNSPTLWDWNFGDGSGTSTQQNPTYTYSNSGNYTVTLVAYNGVGYDTIPKVVTVFANPTVNVGPDQSICLGSATTLSASGGIAYNWSPATGLSSTTVSNPSASPTSTTTYTVTGTDANGCTANDMVTITVFPLPSVNAGVDQTICLGTPVGLSASGAVTYIWSPATTLSSNTVANPTASPTTTTTYTVTGTDANGCTANAMVTVTVNPLPIINYTSHTLCETSGGFATVNLTTMDSYISGGLNMVNWYLDGSYTTPITDPSAFYTDSTIVYTQIVDINSCKNTNIVEINIPINDIVVTPTPADASCNGLCDGSIVLTPSGGMAPFNYSWTPGGMTSNPLTGLCSGTYTYTVIDANGCIQFDDVIISEPLPNSIINGTIYYQTVPITAGIAELIRQNGSLPSEMTLVNTTAVNPVNGVFTFDEVEAGNYIIKVLGDTAIYNCAATYPSLTSQWQLAQQFTITSNCSDSVYVNIDLIELPSNSGTGTINGRLVEGDGGVFNKAPGEPIPDIDITIDQSPGGGIMAATTTDSLGYFTVTNLPSNHRY
ncbi:MAG: PKD domain-containing protein [Bacteroidetes bacterium]|nr:PKD domain-containing protein [Bacteroidota bacterium]